MCKKIAFILIGVFFVISMCSCKTEKSDNLLKLVDFIVEVGVGKDPVVLQLTDTQIIDEGQKRTPDRLNTNGDYAFDQIENNCYKYIREVITETNPDLIIITGDLVYGEFDDSGTVWMSFINFMESFNIPWAPVMGNHDIESKKGADWQCKQLEQAENCLFKQRVLTGNGNYSVGIVQGGQLKRVFFMLDTNGNYNASNESMINGHSCREVGFAQDQIDWYTKQSILIHEKYPNIKVSFAFHIQLYIFNDALEKYGFPNNLPINIDSETNKNNDDFGFIGRTLKDPWDNIQEPWYGTYPIYKSMLNAGVDSIFVGHEHCNSASVIYQGVRFQYGQKSSLYDRINYIEGVPLVGGTVIPFSAIDGTIKQPYIYLCENAGGQIDWIKL